MVRSCDKDDDEKKTCPEICAHTKREHIMQLVRFLLQMLNAFGSAPPQDVHVQDITTLDNTGVRHERNASQPPTLGFQAAAPRAGGDCEPIVLTLGVNKIKLTARPIGNCERCCNMKMRKDIRLLLYTKNNPTNEIPLQIRAGSLKRAGFNPDHPTVVFVHGFVEVCKTSSSSYAIRDAYMGRPEPYNVILVDWTNLSAGPWYGQAAQNTIVVADVLAKFLRAFHKSGELSLDRVHLIGFSLGAQVVGMAGKHLRAWHLVNRITGLDPALPLYPVKDVAHRVTKDDAQFVDIIHTSPLLLGYPVSIGHADFYVNPGADFQPGCTFEDLVLRNEIDDYFSCSHQRAWNTYVDTVKYPDKYPAYQCDSKQRNCKFSNVYMGYNVSRSSRGDYYVRTA